MSQNVLRNVIISKIRNMKLTRYSASNHNSGIKNNIFRELLSAHKGGTDPNQWGTQGTLLQHHKLYSLKKAAHLTKQ